MNKLKINLNSPDLTDIHKAGWFGLCCSLKALEKANGCAKLKNGEWECTNDSITIKWDGDYKPFFDALIDEAFQIDEKGIINLNSYSLFNISYANIITMHDIIDNGLLGNASLYKKKYKSKNNKTPKETISECIDDFIYYYSFNPLTKFMCQNKTFNPFEPNESDGCGWIYPGCDKKKHGTLENTKLIQNPNQALCLTFLFHGIFLYKIYHKDSNDNTIKEYCILIPKIHNFEEAFNIRTLYANNILEDLFVSSSYEALLEIVQKKNIEYDSIKNYVSKIIICGQLPWDKRSASIKYSYIDNDIQELNDDRMKIYTASKNCFKKILKEGKDSDGYKTTKLSLPVFPRLIYENLATGKKIYHNIGKFLMDNKYCLKYEGKDILKMTNYIDSISADEELNAVREICHFVLQKYKMIKFHTYDHKQYIKKWLEAKNTMLYDFTYNCLNQRAFSKMFCEFLTKCQTSIPLLYDGKNSNIINNIISNTNNWEKYKDMIIYSFMSFNDFPNAENNKESEQEQEFEFVPEPQPEQNEEQE